ncbi:TRAP transporter substrate-binding protein [Paenibacillus naphthalenovorans]|uniref:TRAP transporter substrate-binding protein n=1 Tax=Paenibacillus naphthalenovorans TaxID=162209 RepID=UPI003D279F26
MRRLLGTMLVILIGLVAAVAIGFYPTLSSAPAADDDEQQGFDREIVIKFSHVVAENTPKGLAAQDFARRVYQKTDQRVKVEVFPNAVLYNDTDEVDALMNGNIQMITPAFSKISQYVPAWQAFDLPYAFLTDQAVQEAFDGEIGEILFKKLKSKNMIGLSYWSNGFKQMTSARGPLIHPADFKGQQFRIMPSDVLKAQFRLFGAKAVAIPFDEVYRGLESGFVDGGENAISNIDSKKFYQVQKYMTISNHGYLGYAVLMNKDYWDKLPDDLKGLISEALKETTEWANQNAVVMNARQLQEIYDRSMMQIHIQTPEERREWMRVWEPIYEEFEGVIGKDLIDRIRQLQKKYGG